MPNPTTTGHRILLITLVASNMAALALVAYVFHGWRQDHRSHREEVAALNQARMEETANLLQATAQDVADSSLPDPAPVNLNDDAEMFDVYEERIRSLGVAGG